MNDSLWPEDLEQASSERPPVTILREQGAFLAKTTNGLLEVEVSSELPVADTEGVALERFLDRRTSPFKFLHTFSIVAKALGGYRYELFYVVHDIPFYPLDLHVSDTDPAKIGSEEEFLTALRAIFNSPRTREVIRALMAQLRYPGHQTKNADSNSR